MAERLKILAIISELGEFSKSGGLADAVGAFSQQLVCMGHDLRAITPAYASVEQRNQASTVVDSLEVPLDSGEIWCRVLESSLEIEPGASLPKVPVYLVEHEHFFSAKILMVRMGRNIQLTLSVLVFSVKPLCSWDWRWIGFLIFSMPMTGMPHWFRIFYNK